ncbi:YesL family protein [Anaerobacillus isosaccharinicus]|uniref:YesL family protein n=1 Tax=Anaerobacillus isosaccharinicus TaxID=1532552 RepID=A0A7S7L9Y9_9BACI|nr:YesL family protein [Anaerobacillus isosaccharinicus]MBA5584473.1 YesL family protein [Anaerobacillus isosaccharinicus]QOY37141.1 YesL family protein [Anaerobacillus isosaccharinicus]
MNNNHYMDGFYKFSLTFARLAYLNLLWLFFIIIGLGIFGFFPATIALFSIIRQWVKGNTDIPIYKTFWSTYKTEFFKGNLLAVSYFFIGMILYIDILYFSNPTSVVTLVLYYFFWVVAFLFALVGILLFPVYVHYQSKWWQYYKTTFLIMLLNPLLVIATLVIVTGSAVVLRVFPGLIPVFSGSVLAYGLMLVSYHAFNKVEQISSAHKNKELQTVNS